MEKLAHFPFHFFFKVETIKGRLLVYGSSTDKDNSFFNLPICTSAFSELGIRYAMPSSLNSSCSQSLKDSSHLRPWYITLTVNKCSKHCQAHK